MARLCAEITQSTAYPFLWTFVQIVLYRIQTLHADSGIQVAEQALNRNTELSGQRRIDLIGAANGVEPRLT